MKTTVIGKICNAAAIVCALSVLVNMVPAKSAAEVAPPAKVAERGGSGVSISVPGSVVVDPDELSDAERDRRKLLLNVQREITSDDSLSLDARNAMVVDMGDQIVLRGRVAEQKELAMVEANARRAAGRVPVKNEMRVAPRTNP